MDRTGFVRDAAIIGGLGVGVYILYKKGVFDGPKKAADSILKIPSEIVEKVSDTVNDSSIIRPIKDTWDDLTDGNISTKDITKTILRNIPIVKVVDYAGGDEVIDSTSEVIADTWDKSTEQIDKAKEAADKGDWGQATADTLKVSPVINTTVDTWEKATEQAPDAVQQIASGQWSEGLTRVAAATPLGQGIKNLFHL